MKVFKIYPIYAYILYARYKIRPCEKHGFSKSSRYMAIDCLCDSFMIIANTKHIDNSKRVNLIITSVDIIEILAIKKYFF